MKISLTKKTKQSKIERYIRGKQAWFWQLKLYCDSFRRFWRTYGLQVSRKTVAKSLKTLAACDSRRLCMRRITYDSAAVNISVFIEQRNISFQNDISLKTTRLGVLSCEKLKHCETRGRIVSLDQLCLGVEEQLLIFSASCLSPGRVKKLQKLINFCLKVGHSSNLKHLKSIWRQSSRDSCEIYKISTPRNGNDLRQLSFWYRALSCGADWFMKGVYIYRTNLHTSQCPQ